MFVLVAETGSVSARGTATARGSAKGNVRRGGARRGSARVIGIGTPIAPPAISFAHKANSFVDSIASTKILFYL